VENRARVAFQEAETALYKALEKLRSLESKYKELEDSTPITANDYLSINSFFIRTESEIKEQIKVINQLKIDLTEKSEALSLAAKEAEMLRKLRTKHQNIFTKKAEIEESKNSDEISLQRYNRKGT
jgi:flagellar export protein FliJ